MAPATIIPDSSEGLASSTSLSNDDAAKVQKQLDDAVESAFSGGQAKARAEELRRQASGAESAEERERLEDQADELERQADSQLQTSRRLQSGAWQGFGAGAGIGAGTGVALGGVVGTLSGGVLAVPLSLVGGLIGAGTGLLHGPWIKLTRGENGPTIDSAKEGEPGAFKLLPQEVQKINEGLKQSMSGGKDLLKSMTGGSEHKRNVAKPGRKSPKKLEKRGGQVP